MCWPRDAPSQHTAACGSRCPRWPPRSAPCDRTRPLPAPPTDWACCCWKGVMLLPQRRLSATEDPLGTREARPPTTVPAHATAAAWSQPGAPLLSSADGARSGKRLRCAGGGEVAETGRCAVVRDSSCTHIAAGPLNLPSGFFVTDLPRPAGCGGETRTVTAPPVACRRLGVPRSTVWAAGTSPQWDSRAQNLNGG